MQTAGIVMLVYGAFVLRGGVMGPRRAGSQASLTSGVVSGALALASGLALLAGYGWGRTLGLVVSVALVVFFGSRFLRSGRFFPAGLTLMLSLTAALVLLLAR